MGRSEVVPGRPDTKRHRFCYLAVCGQCLFRLVRLLHPLLGVLTGTPPPRPEERSLGAPACFPPEGGAWLRGAGQQRHPPVSGQKPYFLSRS